MQCLSVGACAVFLAVDVDNILDVIPHAVELLVEFIFLITVLAAVYGDVVEAVECPCAGAGAAGNGIVPVHEAKVVDSCRKFEVGQELIGGTEVEAEAETGEAEFVIVDVAPIYQVCVGRLVEIFAGLSLHDALPIFCRPLLLWVRRDPSRLPS